MCGFFLSDYSCAVSAINEIKDVLAMRGTECRLFQTEGFRGFHSRLAITGGTFGSQPLLCSKGCHALVYNGELYGYSQLSDKLADGQVLVDLLCEQGIEALGNFDLTFSGVLIDRKLGKIFVARDGLGKKPLYINYQEEIGVAISSVRFFNGNYDFDLSNLREIGAGEIFVYDLKSRRMLQNYSICYLSGKQTEGVPLSWVDHLKAGINNRLDGLPDVEEINILFSGGIDSIVLNEAIKQGGRKTRIFHLSSNTLDDLFCTKYEQWSGQKVERIRISELDLLSILEEFKQVRYKTYPDYSHVSGFTAFILGRYFRDQNISVVFSGDGADEIFCGYESTEKYFLNGFFNFRTYVQQIKDLRSDQFIKLDLAFGFNRVEVRSPYFAVGFRNLCQMSDFQELLKNGRPKEVVYQIANSLGIPAFLTDRKKEGFNVRIKQEILFQAVRKGRWLFLIALIKAMIIEKLRIRNSWVEVVCR